ncbi:MAG: site-2 protease family protein [Chloroflexi bacterium]|nr:site-2 protease family protein [Chloroflexota bacterium]
MINNTTLSLVEFLLALSFLLFVHELGHFLVGKLFGIHAEEFGFGYPPKLVKLFNLGGTDFTLNLIPFGAFVRFKGEMDPDEPGGLYSANKWKRLGTLLAGSFMNLLTGVVLFAIIISQTGLPQPEIVQIASVEPGSPAAEAGILPGDQILTIEETPVDSLQIVSEITQQNLGEMVEVELLRNNETVFITLIPRTDPPEGQGAMGIVMQNPIQDVGFFRAIPAGMRLGYMQFRQLLSVPGMLIRGEVQGQDARLLSPKGIFDVYSQVREEARPAEQGQPGLAFLNIAWFFALISVSLGFTNLLPIPALDGGRILFIIPELLTGKRIPPKYENMVHLVGYTALLILMGYVFFQDFVNPIVLP